MMLFAAAPLIVAMSAGVVPSTAMRLTLAPVELGTGSTTSSAGEPSSDIAPAFRPRRMLATGAGVLLADGLSLGIALFAAAGTRSYEDGATTAVLAFAISELLLAPIGGLVGASLTEDGSTDGKLLAFLAGMGVQVAAVGVGIGLSYVGDTLGAGDDVLSLGVPLAVVFALHLVGITAVDLWLVQPSAVGVSAPFAQSDNFARRSGAPVPATVPILALKF